MVVLAGEPAVTPSSALEQENERLTEFLYLVPVGLAQLDTLGDVTLMNSTGAQFLMPLADGPALDNLFDVLDPFAPELRNVVRLHTASHGVICEGRRVDLRSLGKTKGPAHIAIGLVKIDPDRVMAVIQDVSRTVEQERALFSDQQRFRAIYEGMRDAMICTVDLNEQIDSWNASGESLFGFAFAEVAGKKLSALVMPDESVASGREGAKSSSLPERARAAGWTELQGWSTRNDGTRFWGEGVLSTLHDESGGVSGYSVVLRDMTERKLTSERLFALATTDALTGLANRRTFCEHAERDIARRARHATPLSILMIDADRFKVVNDTYGHAAGDEVLRHLATLLRKGVRATDLVARFGGEEFVVLLPETTASAALTMAGRLCKSIAAASVDFGGNTLRYTVSIGVAEASVSDDLRTVLSAADAALYRAKEQGRNCAVLAEPRSPA